MMRSRLINAFGLTMTAVVLVIVLITKFLEGAWIAILAMGTFFMIMKGIRRHYDNVGEELAIEDDGPGAPDPGARDRAGLQAAQADACGRWPTPRPAGPTSSRASWSPPSRPSATRSSTSGTRRGIDIPLKILDSPYREVIRPIVEYTRAIRRRPARAASSRSSSRSTSSAAGGSSCCTTRPPCGSRAGCCSRPGVMVTSVPYQLRSSHIGEERVMRQDEQAKSARGFAGYAAREQGGARLSRDAGRRGGGRAPYPGPRPRADAPWSVSASPSTWTASATAASAWPGWTPRGPLVGEVAGTVVFVRHSLPGERVVVRSPRARRRPLPARRRRRGPHRLARPGDAAVPAGRARARPLRRLRPPARRPGRPAPPQGRGRRRAAAPDRPPRARRGRRGAARTTVDGARRRVCTGAPGCATTGSPTAVSACAPAAPDRVVPVPECLVEAPEALVLVEGEQPDRRRGHRDGPRPQLRRRRPTGSGRSTATPPRRWSQAVTSYAAVRPGERVLDLYAGVGLFTVFLADAVGPQGRVDGVEGDAARRGARPREPGGVPVGAPARRVRG